MIRIQGYRFVAGVSFLLTLLSLGAAGFLSGSDAPATLSSPAEDGTLGALTTLSGKAMMDPYPYEALEELSDRIGGRVTGTTQAARAIDWGLARMKALGLENVHKETWMLDRGWTRGSAEGQLTAPVKRSLRVSSFGFVGSTPKGGVEGEVVPVNRYKFDQEIKENASKWTGKILLVIEKGEPPDEKHPQYGKFTEFMEAAQGAKAAAVISGRSDPNAGMQLNHTASGGWNNYFDLPSVTITVEDRKLLERLLEKKDPVRVRINVQNQVSAGPVETANVVGEIRGREHPEEIIVVGGHLDSWDLADGTTDDGMGMATALGAARAIKQAGLVPRRTLRFVLFTGEEQGLLGSLAYTKAHKEEMANHVAAVILDNGQGAVKGLNLGGRKDLIPAVEKFADAVKGIALLKVDDGLSFGTDAGPFTLAGLPGINMAQDPSDYRFTHHSEADTFDKVQQDILSRDTALVALTAYWIADRPERLARPNLPEETARMLVEKKQDVALKAFGIWPFGDLGSKEDKPKD